MSRTIRVPGRRIKAPTPSSTFWHAHAHSNFSAKDALPSVAQMVQTVKRHNQPALALTDHGNMAGAVQLYEHSKRAGILPFPGEEFYIKRDATDKEAKRYHIGILAFTTEGYEALVRLSSWSHTRARFHHKPHIDLSDLAEWSENGWTEGLALTTGCYFGILSQTYLHHGERAALHLLQGFATWFPHTFVELQNHNIEHEPGYTDDDFVEALSDLAYQAGLPVIATQDAHYCEPDDKTEHETLKRLVSWGEDGDDAVFPGDSFHLADEEFVRSHYNGIGAFGLWGRIEEGLTHLLDMHSLTIPALENYSYNVPVVTAGDPFEELVERTSDMLGSHVGDAPRYAERWREELEVVQETGMAGYLMLNAMICDWMRQEGIFYEVRGSASGSLICWALGISQVDPVKEGLRYERFLSKDRKKPPDIDIDVEDSRRGEVLQMLADNFNVCQIGTWAEYGINHETGGGSLLVGYLSRMRKDGVDPATVNSIKTIHDLTAEDRTSVLRLDKHKARSGYGTHAGGLVITSTREEFEALVPTMLVASSDTRVTQYDMDDVEALGLLKEDILGQISLTTMRRAMELLGRDPKDGWGWIPLDDKDTYRAIRQQRVEGVFQLEGWTNKKGCREMRPKKLRDLVHLVSLYRPATMETGMKDLYIRRRAGWEQVPERHPILMSAFRETYGIPVFQDQVIVVLREVGFDPEDLTNFLKAVKASNENIGNAARVISGYKQMFYDLARQSGFEDRDADYTWDAIQGFSKYGFNKAHATTYARRSYRMAYLKTHHPLEFHTALLQTWAGKPKERDYVLATRDAEIKMLGPDVNVSGATWSIDHEKKAIRRGLVSIKGVGYKAALEIEQHAPFRDLEDLIDRCDARSVNGGKNYVKDGTLNGVLAKLRDAKALRSLGVV